MKLSIFRFTWLAFFLCLSACNNKGAPAPAPTNVAVAPGDTTATVTWDMIPGVTYTAWWAPTASLTPNTCSATPTCLAATNVSSPYTISGLTDLTTYSVTVNGRMSGGPGGPGSPSIQVTPRIAGNINSWTGGTITPASGNLNGVIYGNQYVAVGNSGALFASTDGLTWSALSNPLPAKNFNAITTYGNTYLVAGESGVILYSSDNAVTWTQLTSATSNNLNAIYGYAGNLFVAAGDSGTILTSDSSGTVWSAQNSGTASNLRGLTYGASNGTGIYVAVGDAGTVLTSLNAGITWSTNAISTSLASSNLKSVAYGSNLITSAAVATGNYIFVAVGSNGTIITSPDGLNWTQQHPSVVSGANQFTAVTFGRQFVAVDNAGDIFTSLDGVNWAQSLSSASAGLNAVTSGQTYNYSAVGVGGYYLRSQ